MIRQTKAIWLCLRLMKRSLRPKRPKARTGNSLKTWCKMNVQNRAYWEWLNWKNKSTINWQDKVLTIQFGMIIRLEFAGKSKVYLPSNTILFGESIWRIVYGMYLPGLTAKHWKWSQWANLSGPNISQGRSNLSKVLCCLVKCVCVCMLGAH